MYPLIKVVAYSRRYLRERNRRTQRILIATI
ncbi:hypothetical protein DAI22_05g142501 [Oryza sativa Japonica Group]|nr:hypothetical protein DAI22_05g142501 [Oryza sativa Japonica Group]